MAMDVGQAFLDDSIHGNLDFARKPVEVFIDAQTRFNSTACCESLDQASQSREQTNFVEKWRMKQMRDRANLCRDRFHQSYALGNVFRLIGAQVSEVHKPV